VNNLAASRGCDIKLLLNDRLCETFLSHRSLMVLGVEEEWADAIRDEELRPIRVDARPSVDGEWVNDGAVGPSNDGATRPPEWVDVRRLIVKREMSKGKEKAGCNKDIESQIAIATADYDKKKKSSESMVENMCKQYKQHQDTINGLLPDIYRAEDKMYLACHPAGSFRHKKGRAGPYQHDQLCEALTPPQLVVPATPLEARSISSINANGSGGADQ